MFSALRSYLGTWDAWTWFGFFAQAFFFMRFVAQWWATERAGRIVVPGAFWYYSIIGGVLILVYSVVRSDPVFIAGSVLALLIYLRNLVFHRRGMRRAEIP